MKLTLTNESDIAIEPALTVLVEEVAKLTLAHERINANAIVDVMVVDSNGIREINKTHRDKDTATDVLSFPMINFELGERIPLEGEYFLGDIVFSIEAAYSQAKELQHSIDREIGFFIAHSMLHLLGYDHMTDEEERIMMDKQEAILQKASLYR